MLKSWVPPVLVESRRRLLGRTLRFSGTPADWSEAQARSAGYSSADILERVRSATREVVAGRARYERDSVLFDQPEFVFPVLAALLRVAALSRAPLKVVDFGGSLGSTYRQCRPFLEGLAGLEWWVVEQPAFVAAGNAEFATQELRFAGSLTAVPGLTADTVLLASSVLQYIDRPGSILEAFERSAARHLVIDRTPMSDRPGDRLCIQHVPRHIYTGSYPCWILSRSLLLASLAGRWRVISDFAGAEGGMRTDDGLEFEYRGLILEKAA